MVFKRTSILLALSALIILLLGTVTDVDMWLAQSMAGGGTSPFPMRNAWFAETLSHKYFKRLMILAGACFVIPVIYDLWRPLAQWPARLRLRMRVVAVCALLVPTVISILKRLSFSHCPWDMAVFGGVHPYVRLLDPAIGGIPYGHCMPAGHASSELWLISLAVLWLPEHPRKAAAVAAVMLLLGFGVGWIQQLRGAHFLTHTLWSIWIACALVTLVWRIATRKKHYVEQVQLS